MASNPYAVRKTRSRNRWAMWSKKGRAQSLEPVEEFMDLRKDARVQAKCDGDDDDEVRAAEVALDPATDALVARQGRAERMREIMADEREPEPEAQQQREPVCAKQTEEVAGREKLERQTLMLSGSYIHNFDGEYQYVGQANQKPHWQSDSNMHLYWGPDEKWLLRSRFTPNEPTASAYCEDEDLFMGDNLGFLWSANAQWVQSKLCFAPAARSTPQQAGQTDGGNSVVPTSVCLSQCLVDAFDGTYELVGQANGHPHWSCTNGARTDLHLYQGPPEQGLWLLRSRFGPGEKACSAYCSCSHIPTGRNLWHWMQNGEWVPQELELVGVAGAEGAAAPGAGAGAHAGAGEGPAKTDSQWAYSEESVPPLEAGPWDVEAAKLAAVARQAGSGATAGASRTTITSENSSDGIVEQLAEYIRFMIFDADGEGEECRVLAAFEERACLAFATPIEDGFTFEQQALHREFCAMFEDFTSRFLQQRDVSEAALFTALQVALEDLEHKPAEGNTREGSSVAEIMRVLDEVADLRKWAASMRQMLQINDES